MGVRSRMLNIDKVRRHLMNDVHNESNLFTPGNDFNEKYEGRLKYIDNHPNLTDEEKFLVKQRITRNKDARNLLDIRGPKYPCSTNTCNRYSYTVGICEHCYRDALKQNFANWTSGNAEIDEALRSSQLSSPIPQSIIEWIEFEKFRNIKQVAKGNCATFYTAEWTEGCLESIDIVSQTFHRSGPLDNVLLKCFKKSNDPNQTYINELKTHILLDSGSLLVVKVYGISRHPKTGEYILVMENMEYSLKTYVKECRYRLTSKEVYGMFWFVFSALGTMHVRGLLHRNFHFGNILRTQNGTWLISDFGFSEPQRPNDSVYGILEFTPPEIIPTSSKKCKEYTSKSDIYSGGMLMYYAATGNIPFYDFKNKAYLAIHIASGGRPSIPSDIPKPYTEMMKRCWEEDPDKRPTASELAVFFGQQLKDVAENEIFGSKVPSVKISKMPQSAFHFSETFLDIGDENSNIDFSLLGGTKEKKDSAGIFIYDTKEQKSIQLGPFKMSSNKFFLSFLIIMLIFIILYSGTANLKFS